MDSMTTLLERAKLTELSEESRKYLKYGLGTALVGILGYFSYRIFFSRKKKYYDDSSDNNSESEAIFLNNKEKRIIHQQDRGGTTSLLLKTQISLNQHPHDKDPTNKTTPTTTSDKEAKNHDKNQ